MISTLVNNIYIYFFFFCTELFMIRDWYHEVRAVSCQIEYYILKFIAYYLYFIREVRFMALSCLCFHLCVYVSVPPINFWTSRQIYMKLGLKIMPLYTPPLYVLNFQWSVILTRQLCKLIKWELCNVKSWNFIVAVDLRRNMQILLK